MAHAQELSKQVKQLTMRVRELEELLEMRAPHLLKMKVEKQEPNDSPMGSVESEISSDAEEGPVATTSNLSPPAPAHSAPIPTASASQRHEQHVKEGENIKGISEALGSLAIGQDGQMRYRGVTAGAEVSCVLFVFRLLRFTMLIHVTIKVSRRPTTGVCTIRLVYNLFASNSSYSQRTMRASID
jgi:hypothetical protein